MVKIADSFIRSVSIKRQEIEEDSYINSIPAIKSIRKLALDNSLTFFVGENGSGKSTLLEAIAVAYGFNPEGGSKNFNFCTRATHSDLGKAIAIVKGVRSPKDGFFFRWENLLTAIREANGLTDKILFKSKFWEKCRNFALSERQTKMLDGFHGNVTTKKWSIICKCSHDTANRDILDLIAKGILQKEGDGRSTHYIMQ